MHFADISDLQPEPIDWQSYVQVSGIVAIKSTEGVGFTASKFAAHRARAIAAGVERLLVYHFARPDLNNDPVAEANYQYSVVGLVRAQDILVLDFEVENPRSTAEWAYQFLCQQERNYGKVPMIYAASYFVWKYLQDARLARFPLWLAAWTYDANSTPPCPLPWSSFQAWQYSDRGRMAGIPAQVDTNVWFGTVPVTTQKDEEETDVVQPITIQTPGVSAYFEQDGAQWKSKYAFNPTTKKMEPSKNGPHIGHAFLQFYQVAGGTGLNGLTDMGLPMTPEFPIVAGISGQVYERGDILVYDPSHTIDNPPASGPVYKLNMTSKLAQGILQHLFSLGDVSALQGQVKQLTQDNTALSSQVHDLQQHPAEVVRLKSIVAEIGNHVTEANKLVEEAEAA